MDKFQGHGQHYKHCLNSSSPFGLESISRLEFDDTNNGGRQSDANNSYRIKEMYKHKSPKKLKMGPAMDIEPTPVHEENMTIVDTYPLTNVSALLPKRLRSFLLACFPPAVPRSDSKRAQNDKNTDQGGDDDDDDDDDNDSDEEDDNSSKCSLDKKLPASKDIKDSSKDTKEPEFGNIWGYQKDIWKSKFQKLEAFRKKHGHVRVPHNFKEDLGLAQWCKRQRYQYKLQIEGKKSSMTPDRQKALEGLGFVWYSHEAVWEERWTDLQTFQQKFGHCNVPSDFSENPPLAIWVKTMRRQYRLLWRGEPSNMTEERIARLESLGFEWDPRNLGTRGSTTF